MEMDVYVELSYFTKEEDLCDSYCLLQLVCPTHNIL